MFLPICQWSDSKISVLSSFLFPVYMKSLPCKYSTHIMTNAIYPISSHLKTKALKPFTLKAYLTVYNCKKNQMRFLYLYLATACLLLL